MLRVLLARAVCVLALTPALLAAQSAFSIGPAIGYYRPLGSFQPTNIYTTDLPDQPSQLAGLAWGASGDWRPSRRFGLEASVVRTESTLPELPTPGGLRGPTKNHVYIAAVEGEWIASTPGPDYSLVLGAGPSFIRHGGEGYAQVGSPTSWGAALSAELQGRVTQHVEWVLTAAGIPYWFDDHATPRERGMQFDGLLSAGLRWTRR